MDIYYAMIGEGNQMDLIIAIMLLLCRSTSRKSRLSTTIEDYLPDEMRTRVRITNIDAAKYIPISNK